MCEASQSLRKTSEQISKFAKSGPLFAEEGEKKGKGRRRRKKRGRRGESEKEAIQGSGKPAATTTIGTGFSPSKAPLKSHNKVVEALRERKLSERQSGEVGRCPGDSRKIQGLPVAHGLLFPPSEELSFGDDTNSTPAEVSDQISSCKKIGLKSIMCP